MPDWRPWRGQAPKRLRAVVRVDVGGQDVTAKLFPFLISVNAIDKIAEIDECSLELDDRDARLELPAPGEKVSVWMGWEREGASQIFSGVVADVESGFARKGGGRRVWVEATGMNPFGPMKQRDQKSWGQGEKPGGGGEEVPLSQVLGDIASMTGTSISIDSSLGSLKRKFWNMNESPMHFMERIAQEIGGVMKMSGGDQVSITAGGSGLNAAGQELDGVVARWGENLIGWRVKPFIGRPQWGGTAAEFFPLPKGFEGWQSVEGALSSLGGASAKAALPGASPNEQVGEQTNQGMAQQSEEASGAGWFIINGEPSARAGATLMVKGARPGVDGPWKITEAEHSYSRASGYQTRLSVAYPPGSNSNKLDEDRYNSQEFDLPRPA